MNCFNTFNLIESSQPYQKNTPLSFLGSQHMALFYLFSFHVHSFSNFLTGFSVLAACLRVSISQGLSLIFSIPETSSIFTLMTTFLSPTWTFSLNLLPLFKLPDGYLVFNFAAWPQTQLLYNWIHHFFSSSSLPCSSIWLLYSNSIAFSQEPKFNMHIILDSSLSPLSSIVHQLPRFSHHFFIISLQPQGQKIETITR